MTDFFFKILNMSISAGWLILAIVLLRLLLKNAPKWIRVCLWGLAGLRLLIPFSIQSVFSLIPSSETISPDIMLDATPNVHTGILTLNQVINPVLESSFAPAPLTSANPLQIWFPIFTVIWVIGMVCMAGYGILSYWWLRRSVRMAVPLEKHIYQCEHVSSPFILGIFCPRIYLPFHMKEQELSAIIAHEKAHLSRKDHWWKPLGFGLLTVYWFHPLIWLAYILLCRDIELACDEKVIGKLGNEERADYSQVLLSFSVSQRKIAACPLAFGEVGVKKRIKSILSYKKPAFWVLASAVVTLVIAAVCFLTDPLPRENYLKMDGTHSVSGQEETIRYELEMNHPPMMAVVVAEQWAKGKGVFSSTLVLPKYTEKLEVQMQLRYEERNPVGTEVRFGTYQNGDRSSTTYLPTYFAFPEDYNPTGWSFTGYKQNEKIPIELGCDKILAVMACDVGNGVRTVDCETLIKEPERLLEADYMIVVRISFTDSVSSYSPKSRPATPPMPYPTEAKLYGVFDKYLYLPMEGVTYRYEQTDIDPKRLTQGDLLAGFTEQADPQNVEWKVYAVEEYPELGVVLASAEGGFICAYQASPSKRSGGEVLSQAKRSGCYVIMEDGDITSGQELWQSFVENTEKGKQDFINILHYYTLDPEHCSEEYYEAYKEDYPVAYQMELWYDGETYTLKWFEGIEGYERTYQYLMHYTGEAPTATATYDTYERYVLTNDDTLTWDQIQWGMFSSQFGDYIDHYSVYTDLHKK